MVIAPGFYHPDQQYLGLHLQLHQRPLEARLGAFGIHAHLYSDDWIEEPDLYTRGGTGDAQYVQIQNVEAFSLVALGGDNTIYILASSTATSRRTPRS